MKRFPIDFTVSASVDCVARDPRTLWFHQQTEPYPGGHRYEVVLSGAAALEVFRELPQDLAGPLDRDRTNRFLQQLYWTFEAPEDGISWEFVLNTIDTVRATAGTLSIGGDCSPFVSGSNPRVPLASS